MSDFKLSEPADIGFLFESVRARYPEDEWHKLTAGVLCRDDFVAHCRQQGYRSAGFFYRGQTVGGLIFDGQAVHIEVVPAFHGRWAFLLKQALEWVFAQKDPIQVAVPVDSEKCLRFMARNNWPRVHEDERFITFEMSSKAPPHYADRQRAGTDRGPSSDQAGGPPP